MKIMRINIIEKNKKYEIFQFNKKIQNQLIIKKK